MALTQISTQGIKDGTITGSDLATNVDLVDNQKLRLGTGNDLEIYHDGSHSYALNTTGNLFLGSNSSVDIGDGDFTKYAARFKDDGAVELYHNGNKKFETTSTGALFSGNFVSFNGNGYIRLDSTGHLRLQMGTNGTMFTNQFNQELINIDTSGHFIIPNDTGKIKLGTGQDLQIYHDGSHSRIVDSGTGFLTVQSSRFQINNAANTENMAAFIENGAVELYFDNSKKFETTSTGASITGALTTNTSGGNAVLGSHLDLGDNQKARFGASDDLQIYYDGTDGFINQANNALKFTYNGTTKFFFGSSYLSFQDDYRIGMGNSQDLEIYHNGTNAQIDNNTGNLEIRNKGTFSGTRNIFLRAKVDEASVTCKSDGAVELYFDNSKKFETTTAGATVTGSLGIGTTSPTQTLDITASNGVGIAEFTNTATSFSNNCYTVKIDSSAHISNVTAAGAFAVDVNSGRAMTINGQGEVGIGTSNPTDKLHVVGDVEFELENEFDLKTTGSGTKFPIRIFNSDASAGNKIGIGFGAANNILCSRIAGIAESDFTSGANRDGGLTFESRLNGTFIEAMRIDSSGNTFVNCTSDPLSQNAKFAVQHGGDGQSVAVFDFNQNFSRPNMFIKHARAGAVSGTKVAKMIAFLNLSGTEVGTIQSGLAGTSFNTSSDYRLKENITNISDGITRIKQLIPKKFNFIGDGDKTLKDGFLAHEVSSVVPEAITGTKDEVDENNQPVYQGIDQSKLVPLLVAAVQEAIAKIEVLETKVASLKAS